MSDDLGLFEDEAEEDRASDARGGGAGKRRNRKSVVTLAVAVLLLGVVGVGAYYGVRELSGIGGYEDFEGEGSGSVIVEVPEGANLSQIGQAMVDEGVVASVRAFTVAAEQDARARGVQPGFYELRSEMSGEAAVSMLLDGGSLGQVEIRGGKLLHDVDLPNGDVDPGIISLLAQASCHEADGAESCVSTEELWDVATNADLAELGVPEWAVGPASAAPAPERRLEGLILRGMYTVRPGWDAQEILTHVISRSAQSMQAIGMPELTNETGFTPYEVLIIGSLNEKEAVERDFAKVARVTYNRLQADQQKLEYDSTVNYWNNKSAIRTRPEERADTSNPYNTYQHLGLPPTPVSAPSVEALQAAAQPEEGDWMYFVKCETDGTTCFNYTLDEHQADVQRAQEAGVW
ncbi:endolytic transglycosylase MltG [Actinoalloteichus sp. AHMU CJ021]|uniref:Endolytic murein transglycosylase n=1 Tax=Actinoalloteichus caeruleus DSM 43889 TaxID=1120930 RepID=A0ABT1JG45_ACTCY|nr:endolytic transglycosylase MltG [Actinoalloteichus caeruleus]AUS77583.1 endolytic transglycosylase MltG [Actinoalloteichus sp. AHMU CJ021]MCP2331465.1 UPF0755 protein [Actinoalloteichus caeruleus DSM 43889]